MERVCGACLNGCALTCMLCMCPVHMLHVQGQQGLQKLCFTPSNVAGKSSQPAEILSLNQIRGAVQGHIRKFLPAVLHRFWLMKNVEYDPNHQHGFSLINYVHQSLLSDPKP